MKPDEIEVEEVEEVEGAELPEGEEAVEEAASYVSASLSQLADEIDAGGDNATSNNFGRIASQLAEAATLDDDDSWQRDPALAVSVSQAAEPAEFTIPESDHVPSRVVSLIFSIWLLRDT
jgi:hypothetical protein